MEVIEKTKLWNKTLEPQNGHDPNSKSREILRQAFIQTRDAVKPLVAQIGNELPDLTVHDITHLDSLWSVADVIMGDDFDINPTEAFVLGMTFLIHDAACTTYAYPDGIEGLKKTTEWQDIVAQKAFTEDEMKNGAAGYRTALFETLRVLHPKQAEDLLSQSWPSLSGQDRFLMENVELRNYYGKVIGLIASSHGKDAAFAEQQWGNANKLSTPNCLKLGESEGWTVDCLKIAMLLRCTDAAHIDNKRAPDMLASIKPPSEASLNYWIFQNNLSQISVNNQKEIYWTSGTNFQEHESDAWWLCYETMKMIDGEIKTSNRILKNNGRKELGVKGVAGLSDISTFEQNVPVQGWQPVDISFKIKNVGDVIEKFGGEKLYGKNPHLALRELIQNAADAIRARRLHQDSPELGQIEISLTKDQGNWWLNVEDTGIGMSTYVLSEVLLDFGRSFWKDAKVREEWAGLASKRFEAVGQFGVGFFSVFMLGDEVKVTSWRYGDAKDKQATLHLRNATKSKPILLNTPKSYQLKEFGTRISIRLKNGRLSLLQQIPIDGLPHFGNNHPTKEMTLSQAIGVLAPALDITVWCKDGDGSRERVIEANDWSTISPLALMQRIAPVYLDDHLEKCVERFSNIIQGKEVVGRASLYKTGLGGFGYDLGLLVHRGLNMGRWDGSGLLLSNNNEDLARSTATPICSRDALVAWAEKIKAMSKEEFIHPYTSNILLSLGLKSDDLFIARIEMDYITGNDFNELLHQDSVDELVFLLDHVQCPESLSQKDFEADFELDNKVFDFTGDRGIRADFGLEGWIHELLPQSEETPRTTWAAIDSYIMKKWPNVEYAQEGRIVGTSCGQSIKANCGVYKLK